MPYWGSSDDSAAHSHGPCEYCDDLLDVLRREEAENTRLRALSLAPRDHDGERETLRAENARLRAALLQFGEVKGFKGVMSRDEFWSLLLGRSEREARDA